MPKVTFHKHPLQFNEPGGTSRGVLLEKPSWIIRLEEGNKIGIGEISLIPGLNPESPELVQAALDCGDSVLNMNLDHLPSLRFGLEMAQLSLQSASPFLLFPSAFTQGKAGIRINGLIWMGNKDTMVKRVKEKLDQGFRCLKLKVGAINFEEELSILKEIRKNFGVNDLEIRLDANGAFTGIAEQRLKALHPFGIHSIEQPIKPRHWQEMTDLCRQAIIPIALDEELIGITTEAEMRTIIHTIAPQYLIFKPSLIGGFGKCDNWIQLCSENNIPWWATSALESNIGLNAIAQWVFQKNNALPQGLGTGGVFSNNFSSPLHLKQDELYFSPEQSWSTIPGL
ncbi:MAG: O-succinylbenzoate synthase [Sphingobacteriales bacterium]|jgi:O-succinylbenzoate synthase